MDRDILVTGGTGLLGSHILIHLLQQGKHIRAMYRSEASRQRVSLLFKDVGLPDGLQDNIEWVKADLNDLFSLEEAFEGIKRVYHCAAMVSFAKKDRAKMFQTNIDGTEHIVNLCLRRGVEKLVHVSSIASLSSSANGEPITESSAWSLSNKSAYSWSKTKSEMLVWRAVEEGLDVAVVNPSVILGAGDWNNGSANLFDLVFKGLKYYTSGSTGFVDVQDVAEAMFKIMESPSKNKRYILNAANLTYQQFFGLMADALEVEPPKKEAKPWLLSLAWRMSRLLSLFGIPAKLSKEAAKAALSKKSYSSKKFCEEFGFVFKPIETSIREIAAIYKWQLDQNP